MIAGRQAAKFLTLLLAMDVIRELVLQGGAVHLGQPPCDLGVSFSQNDVPARSYKAPPTMTDPAPLTRPMCCLVMSCLTNNRVSSITASGGGSEIAHSLLLSCLHCRNINAQHDDASTAQNLCRHNHVRFDR